MNPHRQVCHPPQGRARGPVGRGHLRGHRQAERRSQGPTGRRTFAAPTGTPFDRWRTAGDLVTLVLTRLGHGCPLQALVAACGLAARTVAAWVARAGHHGQPGQQHVIQQGRVDLPHGQAEARWVKLVGRRVGLAMALTMPSRRWWGGLMGPQRDLALITALVQLVRSCARRLASWVGVDGWASSITAGLRVCRPPVRTGRRGRPRRVLERGVRLGHVVQR
jgi:hypothetical protein